MQSETCVSSLGEEPVHLSKFFLRLARVYTENPHCRAGIKKKSTLKDLLLLQGPFYPSDMNNIRAK